MGTFALFKKKGLPDPAFDLSLEQIQDLLYDMMCKFSTFCEVHGLRYCLCGGTLLGAVRHQGFIPWDDDIDIMMPRPDYMKMHELLLESPLSDTRQLISIEAQNATIPYAKIIDTRYGVYDPLDVRDNYLWIDIFPIDGVPADKEECAQYLAEAHKLKKRLLLASAPMGTGFTLARAILKLPAVLYEHIKLAFAGSDYYGQAISSRAQSIDFDTSEYVASVAWTCGPQERMKKSDLLMSTTMRFRDRHFAAGGNWQAYLEAMYGDYMTVPRAEDRVNHAFRCFSLV
ncbi:MAG: LicD family protein [Coriobacteriales bacterium]|nr:LicD family protein [Coriobacteriales bacterium]